MCREHDAPGEREPLRPRPVGRGEDIELANRFLDHLSTRCFSPATRRAYAFDLLSFFRFCTERDLRLAAVQQGLTWRPP